MVSNLIPCHQGLLENSSLGLRLDPSAVCNYNLSFHLSTDIVVSVVSVKIQETHLRLRAVNLIFHIL